MPYVAPEDALNHAAVDLYALRAEMGAPPWRKPLLGTPVTRCVLIEWPAGFVAQRHRHPRAVETFHVLDGTALFRFDDGLDGQTTERLAGPGTILFAPRGVRHTITVPGPESLLLLVALSPNEDAPDETIED